MKFLLQIELVRNGSNELQEGNMKGANSQLLTLKLFNQNSTTQQILCLPSRQEFVVVISSNKIVLYPNTLEFQQAYFTPCRTFQQLLRGRVKHKTYLNLNSSNQYSLLKATPHIYVIFFPNWKLQSRYKKLILLSSPKRSKKELNNFWKSLQQ